MRRLLTFLAIFSLIVPSTAHAVGPGDEGIKVAQVQLLLKGYGYTVTVDGVYGPQTEKAVRSWQKSNGLTVDGIAGPITLDSLMSARRVGNAQPMGGGLGGLPFAPPGLTNCEEMSFYRVQAELPDVFESIGYRESRCRNDVVSSISCCYGYWQNYISSHLSRYSAYRVPIIEKCQVRGVDDIYGLDSLQKQKQACVTAVVYGISGLTPWRATT